MQPGTKSDARASRGQQSIVAPRYSYPLSHEEYDALCRELRARVVEMSHSARAPHLASALSCIEIVAALYGSVLNIDPRNPMDEARDRFVFSKGHAASTLYATLAFFGFFPESELASYGKSSGRLAEQPSPYCMPGVEAATGSLGHGLPLGLGMAKAAKILTRSYKTFVLMSDGECNEGSVWEAALLAPAHKLDNLIVLVDFNKWQATGRSTEVTSLEPLAKKWEAFGWNSFEIDGHNVGELLSALDNANSSNGKPTAIVAHTVKGKGISFMEDDNNWHYRVPTETEVVASKRELGLL